MCSVVAAAAAEPTPPPQVNVMKLPPSLLLLLLAPSVVPLARDFRFEVATVRPTPLCEATATVLPHEPPLLRSFFFSFFLFRFVPFSASPSLPFYLRRSTQVTDFKSEVIFDISGCLEAVVASEAAKIQSHLYCSCQRKYIGPLPSCFDNPVHLT